MKSEKSSSTKFLSIGIGAGIAILILTLLIIFFITNKPSVAFYKVSDSVIQNSLKIINENSRKKYAPIILDSSVPLGAQKTKFKNASILITENTLEVADFTKTSGKAKKIPAAYLNGMASTISATVPKYKNTINYLPILYDFYQIDVNYDLYKKTKIKNIDYWDDFLKMAKAEVKKVPYPIVLGGNHQEDFINIFGMMIESGLSYNEYDEILYALYTAWKTDNLAQDEKSPYRNILQVLDFYSEDGNILNVISAKFSQLIEANLITPELLKNDFTAATFYADNNLCGNLFTTLSQHRKIDKKVINDYKSIYCPSQEENIERKFVAPEICAVPLKNDKTTLSHIINLASKKQTELSTTTGLAPVQKNCQVADHQADDVRYWIAASSGPLMPLSAALPESQAVSFVNNYLMNLVLGLK